MLRTPAAQQPHKTPITVYKPFQRQSCSEQLYLKGCFCWAPVRHGPPSCLWSIRSYFPNAEIFLCHTEMDEPLNLHTEKPKTIRSLWVAGRGLGSKVLAFHSLYLHVIVTSPLLSCHALYPGKEENAQRGLTSNQHFGRVSLFELVECGQWDPDWTIAEAFNTQEVWALGPSIRMNDDSGDRRLTGGSSEGRFPQTLVVTYASCLVSPGQWVTQTTEFLSHPHSSSCRLSLTEQSKEMDFPRGEPGPILQFFLRSLKALGHVICHSFRKQFCHNAMNSVFVAQFWL